MESGIEYDHFGNFRAENVKTSPDTLHMSGIMQGCKGDKALYALYDIFIDKNGFTEQSTTLHDSVTDRRNFVKILDNTVIFADEGIFDLYKCFGMVVHDDICFINSAVARSVFEMTVNTDSFTIAFCDNAFIVHVYELIFHR